MESEASTTNTSIYEFKAQRRPPNYRWREELLRLEDQKKRAEGLASFWFWVFIFTCILSGMMLVYIVLG